ncbi:MAG: hypothetical protein COV02_01400 [Candidatus Terrybacteria bacterium CG10_big_fil_rev_8_21_14_0_10_41_10]|uniref:DUF86 domain-containing protein n=1 Tax=Candidatus Terrybacteria bacterium CG10_big_fil_rev_8_21_14_0_10_41_10 TaxID=1975026 RepID=A0A2M8LAK3_9BACT|nr:MAG: hypothetical protein COV02_01400 [Candidatus Terrybacteria bacterium CG10_big_fil_rev_8_21_14_0_10_41_10]
MFDKQLVEKKINQIIEYLEELEPITRMSCEEISGDYFKIHTAERLLQLIVDTMVDINVHFIKEKNLSVPDDLQSTFLTLADSEILPKDFAAKIAPVVGLRNKTVHQYEKIDKELFIKKLKENFGDFKKYLVLIEKNI